MSRPESFALVQQLIRSPALKSKVVHALSSLWNNERTISSYSYPIPTRLLTGVHRSKHIITCIPYPAVQTGRKRESLMASCCVTSLYILVRYIRQHPQISSDASPQRTATKEKAQPNSKTPEKIRLTRSIYFVPMSRIWNCLGPERLGLSDAE